MKFKLDIDEQVFKELQKLTAKDYGLIARRMLSLLENPRENAVQLETGKYRARAGDYRILYTVDDEKAVVTVFLVDQRGRVYERYRRLPS